MRSQNKTLPGAVLALLAALLSVLPAHAQRMPQDSWYLAKEFRGDIEGGKLYNPRNASADRFGNIYVADDANHQIQVFDPNGNFLRKWGGYGTITGTFARPHGVHVSSDDKVYVAEYDGDRVQVFDLNGKFVRVVGQSGSGDGQLTGAVDVTTDSAGNIYVADYDLHRIMVFTSQGTYLRQWGSNGTGDSQFKVPTSLCRLSGDKIAVADRDNHRVQIFNSDGTFVAKFGSYGSAAGQFNAPHGIRADSAGNLYVSQHGWDKVQVFNSALAYVRTIGSEGSGNGQFQDPYGPAVANGKVYIPSASNHRLNVFSESGGTWIQNFGSFGNRNFDDTHGIAVDAQGNIYISDHQKNEIRKFDANYNFIKRFGSAGSGDGQFNGVLEMAIGPNSRLYVVDHGGHRVQYFDLDGNFLGKFGSNGSGNGNFKYPWGIAVSKDNKVYVADRDNHRIQVFDANGNYLNKFGTQGSFDGQFQSPMGLAVTPSGELLVADSVNVRIQKFDGSGIFIAKAPSPFIYYPEYDWGSKVQRVSVGSDGLVFLSIKLYEPWWSNEPYKMVVLDSSLNMLKSWNSPLSPMAETKSGDLIAAHGDRVVRVWKRTFRTVHPEPANALPLPTIVAQKRRPGTALVDVDYTVKDADNTTVQTAALAFKNGGNSLSDVIPITSFAEGTGNKLGANIATGQTNRFTWDVARDWSTDFGEVQLEILAKDGRGLLNLDFIQIPATGDQPALKISRSPLNDNDFLSVWYWLIATGSSGIKLENGILSATDGSQGFISGVSATYFQDWNFSGTNTNRVDSLPYTATSSTNSTISGIPFVARSIRWAADFVPQKTGSYTFSITRSGSFSAVVNGTQYANTNTNIALLAEANVAVPVIFQIATTNSTSATRSLSIKVTPPGESQRAVVNSDFRTSTVLLATSTTTTQLGRTYLFQKMGLREATAAEVTRAKEAGTPGVINQWDPKLRVGPDERPAKINAYGFDTGADGYWVVPVTNTNSSN